MVQPQPIIARAQPVVQPQPVVQVRAPAQPVFTAPLTVASEAPVAPLAKPVAITRMVHNAPGMHIQAPQTWDYAFEAENVIIPSNMKNKKPLIITGEKSDSFSLKISKDYLM